MSNYTPLADRMRPRNFDEFFGQEEIVGEGKMLRRLVENGEISSLIFWGPPGVGKTTLANIIALNVNARFISVSAVMSGKEDLKKAIVDAEYHLRLENKRTLLFVDEIHRWNKAQQDALLPFVEKGIVILIGATTENPSFEIIGALLSRSRVFILRRLEEKDIFEIIKNALKDKKRGLGNFEVKIKNSAIKLLANLCGGDARVALNGIELAVKSNIPGHEIGEMEIKEALQRTNIIFDKKGEEFYNLISALHKSMRGSDADASLYWLARMLEGGADPLYVARRVLRFASEDIGMANSEAVVQANAAYDACHKIGMPECSVHLAQAVVYCAKSGKSNLLYTAYEQAAEDARSTSHLGVPIHLRNAPTKFMKEIGYGKNYKYSPDFNYKEKQEYMPSELVGKTYLKNDLAVKNKFLLHVCCAPCSIAVVDELRNKFDVHVFFYNPNIYPREEYLKRKAEVVKVCEEWNIKIIDMDVDAQKWCDKVAFGREDELEGGERCRLCCRFRLAKTADYAAKNGYKYFGTSLTSGRNKDSSIINPMGLALAKYYKIRFYDVDWKKDGRQEKSARMVKSRGIYRQDYCGCRFSLNAKEKTE
jgi:putative ATPase